MPLHSIRHTLRVTSEVAAGCWVACATKVPASVLSSTSCVDGRDIVILMVGSFEGHHGHAVIALDRPLNVEAASRERHDRNKRRNGCVVCWEQGRHSRSEKESKAPQIGRDDSVNAEMCSERILPPI